MLVDVANQPDAMMMQAALATERPRLVSFCAHVSGSWDAAEDLAQETLLEAWRVRDRLHDADGLASWLTAIARNVCLRWRRSKGRESVYLAHGEALSDALEAWGAEDGDNVAEVVERPEVSATLKKALATLPVATRVALIGSYVDETPQAELAARLGLSEGALRVRLHRGKLALREALAPADTASAQDGWQETRIWCPFCGRRRLKRWVDSESDAYSFRCSGPCVSGRGMIGSAYAPPPGAQGLTNSKSLLARHCLNLGILYRKALTSGRGSNCMRCGSDLVVGQWLPGDALPDRASPYEMFVRCPTCDLLDSGSPWHLSLDTPEAQRFWRRHPRMRALPTQEVETAGRPALVIGYESVTGNERLEIVADRATFETLHVYGEASQ
ncbi:MAG TPA: RNA polymerase sigma factor [Ktedonobacterales bacterium]|jgi:RNA polymerase sigma factor (sigma-70 family)|nr:RNA polymerase sigma factor [Ktedonobacterales bacterium]